MTKEEAKIEMRAGKKLTHTYFDPYEWVIMDGNTIVLEDGVRCSEYEFWRWRDTEIFETGWSIYKD